MSNGEEGGGSVIRYTTKELLAEIREGISDIKHTTDNHENRIRDLELRHKEDERRRRDEMESRTAGWTRIHTLVAFAVGIAVFSLDFYLAVKPH